jgi:uncharacterized membrane protein YkoI
MIYSSLFRNFFLAMALLLTTANAMADDEQDVARELVKHGEILPLEKILEQARQIHPGRILEAEMDHHGTDYIYEIEILDAQGRVWELKINARDGKVINKERED